MRLGEFIDQLRNQVDAFDGMFKNNNRVDPKNYPVEMDEVDWYEQFAAYMEE